MGYTSMTTDELIEQKRQIESELLGRIDEEIDKLDVRRAELLAMKPTEKPKEPAKKKRVKSSRPASSPAIASGAVRWLQVLHRCGLAVRIRFAAFVR